MSAPSDPARFGAMGHTGLVNATQLAAAVADAAPGEIVRLVADWIDRALRSREVDLDAEPPLAGESHLDALAAAAAHVARRRGRSAPAWTIGPDRMTEAFWYPGPAALSRTRWSTRPASSRSGASSSKPARWCRCRAQSPRPR